MTLEQYRDQQLDLYATAMKQAIEQIEQKLDCQRRNFFEKQLASLRIKMEQAENEALSRYDRQMSEIENMRQQGFDEDLIQLTENFAKKMLETMINLKQTLLQQFIKEWN